MKVLDRNFDFAVSAAGRINIIGEHIDYCGGQVLPAALSLKNTVYIRANGRNEINLSWTDVPDRITLDLDADSSVRRVLSVYGVTEDGGRAASVLGSDALFELSPESVELLGRLRNAAGSPRGAPQRE